MKAGQCQRVIGSVCFNDVMRDTMNITKHVKKYWFGKRVSNGTICSLRTRPGEKAICPVVGRRCELQLTSIVAVIASCSAFFKGPQLLGPFHSPPNCLHLIITLIAEQDGS